MSQSFRKPRNRSTYTTLLYILCLALAYYGAGKLSMLLAIPPGYTAPVWPSAGIGLVGILLFGYRVWPGILIGVILVNLGIETAWHVNSILPLILLGTSVGIGATAQALAGAFLVRRYAGYPNPLAQEREVVLFLLLAGPAACLISATWGVASLLSAGVIEFAGAPVNWITWWVGDALGVVCVTPVLLVWLAQPRELWVTRRKQVSVPLCTAVITVVSFLIYANDREDQRIKAEFERRADNLTRVLQDKIDESLETLHSLSGFYAASERVTREEFEIYATGLMDRFSGIQRLSWNPIITHQERRNFEEAARRGSYEDFEIREVDPQGRLVRAEPRENYAPVYFVAPYKENRFALGFDLTANPLMAEGLRRARDEDRAGATTPIKLLGETQDQWGVVAFLPVYRPGSPRDTVEARRRNIYGYVGGAFRVPDLMATSVAVVREPGVQLEIWDDDKNSKLIQRYSASALRKQAPDFPTLRKTGSVLVADRRWRVECYPTVEFFALQRSWQVWSVLFGGLLFTGVLGAFLLVVSGRTAMIERLVEERTRELARANLDRADFSAMIAHDLRSPLMAVTGVAGLLRENAAGEVNEEQKKWLGKIQDNAQHMVQIVNDFLDVSHLESGRVHLVKKEIDLGQLVENCLNNVFSLAREKNISLKNASSQPLPKIRADGRRLEQVISNLLSNALKFTGAGGEISVGCQQSNGNIITWVKDSGVGISGQELSWIFEKYRQTKSGQNTAEKGTGLGLAICKMIVEAHRGRIWVESAEDKGATFYFSLPVDSG